jgi:hypothetical protein
MTRPWGSRPGPRHRGVQLRGCCTGRCGVRGVLLGLSQFRDGSRQGNEIRDEREGCERAVSADVPHQRH